MAFLIFGGFKRKVLYRRYFSMNNGCALILLVFLILVQYMSANELVLQ